MVVDPRTVSSVRTIRENCINWKCTFLLSRVQALHASLFLRGGTAGSGARTGPSPPTGLGGSDPAQARPNAVQRPHDSGCPSQRKRARRQGSQPSTHSDALSPRRRQPAHGLHARGERRLHEWASGALTYCHHSVFCHACDTSGQTEPPNRIAIAYLQLEHAYDKRRSLIVLLN